MLYDSFSIEGKSKKAGVPTDKGNTRTKLFLRVYARIL